MLSREALELLEFTLGPKAKRGRGDPNAKRVGKQFGKTILGVAALPVYSVFGRGSHQQRSANAVAAISRTVKKKPEVMVKMTGRQNGQAHVAENFSYIARLGWGEDKELELLTSEGKIITNRKEMSALAREWHLHETADITRLRKRAEPETVSLVLRIPDGVTSAQMVTIAETFAAKEMAGRECNIKLNMKHDKPHILMSIAGKNVALSYLSVSEEDLTNYRKHLAQELRNIGGTIEEKDVLHIRRARRQGSTSLSFILSMPPGTDPEKMKSAAVEFAKTEMVGRQWVMGLHTDQAHPHVHLTVARRDIDGKRFHPGKEDLFRYRQTFAEKLRDVGIEANATPRKARGITRKSLSTPIAQMAKRGEDSRYAKRLQREAAVAAITGTATTPFDENIREQRISVLESYLKAGKELLQSPDNDNSTLAAQLAKFIKELPKIQTRAARGLEIYQAAQTRAQQRPPAEIATQPHPPAPNKGRER